MTQASRTLDRENVMRAADAAGRLGHVQEQRELLRKVDELDVAIAAARDQWAETNDDPPPSPPLPVWPAIPHDELPSAAAIHEAGHAIALIAVGCELSSIELHEGGGGRCLGVEPERLLFKLIVAASGEAAERAAGLRGSQLNCENDGEQFNRAAAQLELRESYAVKARSLMISHHLAVETTDDNATIARALLRQRALSGAVLRLALGTAPNRCRAALERLLIEVPLYG